MYPLWGEDETKDFLWFACPYVIQVVDMVMGWAGVSHRAATLSDWLDWFSGDTRPRSVMFASKLLILSCIIYYTWRARNVRIFEEALFVCFFMHEDDY